MLMRSEVKYEGPASVTSEECRDAARVLGKEFGKKSKCGKRHGLDCALEDAT